jgi:hypothetical protein
MKEQDRQYWNKQQKLLRASLTQPENVQSSIDLFLHQHAMVHAAELTPAEPIHFVETIFLGLTENHWRTILPKGEHSIAWVIWHIARIEDITMNILLAGNEQRFTRENWQSRLNIPFVDTGNSMTMDEVQQMSAAIDIAALKQYRLAVAQDTRGIVQALTWKELKRKVDAGRLQKILDIGAVRSRAVGLIEYWGGLKSFGLMLMPPTRHNFVHLNEARKLKEGLLKDQRKEMGQSF